ncbi:fasciclin domain-containing protein [Pseudonocardia humida]|uniref:Fasciclin domain-containing protein n=1 Tax=Pseudonocardia humida TaxID=2800819 RepID=A0ABT1A189_9PSEU|nr:fasciclin domain-containing protein [Pseudonocardia humida]MCO1656771.1 fasciclin domain-containing protein [Pseudonocardia humida]
MHRIRMCATALTLTAVAAGAVACAGPVTAPGTGAAPLVAPAASATPMAEPYGDCADVPTTELGNRPLVAALAAVPRLAALSAALGRLPALAGALDAAPALTVFAPTDAAFEALRGRLGAPEFDALMGDAERLDGLLSYHVTEKRLDARGLVEAGKTTQLAWGDVTVADTPEMLTLASTDEGTAGVVCGNVQSANATVFLVDAVLTPATPTAPPAP